MQNPLTVYELSQRIKTCVDNNPLLSNVWVKGEITGITYHSSGNIYFTLKDKDSLISAAFFRYMNSKLKFKLNEGQSIIALGSVVIYDKRGSYQLKVADIMLEGVGEIQLMLDELKKKLAKEGLFDASKKRPFPFLPKRIGIVTSPTGAALRDILKVALRRYPNLEIILAPAKVQGSDSPKSIIKAIRELNREKWNVDLIIAGRGGGSVEDLLPFSDEGVVRAFAESRVPIISAVGHQIDHPISDEAADYAAPTPSAAAEFAVQDKSQLSASVLQFSRRMDYALRKIISSADGRLVNVETKKIFTEPKAAFEFKEYELDRISESLHYALNEKLRDSSARLDKCSRFEKDMILITRSKEMLFAKGAELLEKLSPLSTIARGYSVPLDSAGRIINSVDKAKQGENIKLLLSDGSLGCCVNSVNKGDVLGKEKEKN